MIRSPWRSKSHKNSVWDPFSFFLLISFLPALLLTILFISLNIKTIFWSEPSFSLRRPGGYIGVFLILWLCVVFISVLIYVIYFLLRTIKEGKKQSKKMTTKLYFIFLGSQLLTFFLLVILVKKGWKRGCYWGVPSLFGLIIANGFLTHFLFSKPTVKLLRRQYPYYFPKFFNADRYGRTIGWPITITMIIFNLQLFSLLFLIINQKKS